jgi:drug/metabolite transporter (DMT)-like permease
LIMNESVMKKIAKPLIVLAAIIWGASFVIMKDTLDNLPPLFLLAFRFLIAAVLLAAIFYKRLKAMDRRYFLYGSVMGILLFFAYMTQTYGLAGTTPGKNAFLTASYCIIVPFLNWIVEKKRPDRYNISAALLCVAGIGLVSLTTSLTMTQGDALTLVCGFFYASHIIAVNAFSKKRDIFLLTVVQFITAGAVSLILAVLFDTMPGTLPRGAAIQLLYLSVAATAFALLFQNVGQKYTEPTAASVLLSLEAPFGVLYSVLFYAERPAARMIAGFVLIFLAVLCSETKLSFLKKKAGKDSKEEAVHGRAD